MISELAKIDKRTDGDVEVIDVKLNNRKTKKIGDTKNKNEKIKLNNSIHQNLFRKNFQTKIKSK